MRSPRAILGVPLILVLSTIALTSCEEECCPGENVFPTVYDERWIEDSHFVMNTYFFLDRAPSEQFLDRFFRPKEGWIEIYRSATPAPQAPWTWGLAYVDSLGHGAGIGLGEYFEKDQFKLLTAIDDYRFVRDPATDRVIGIELVQPISRGEVLAVSYVNELGDTIGDFGKPASHDESEPLMLELIWPSEPLPQGRFGYTWAYMMRNIYNLDLHNIDFSTFDVDIHEIANRPDTSTPDSSSVPWIRIFGLDQTDATGNGPPDGKVDLLAGVIDPERSRLIFPGVTPFDPRPEDVEKWTNGEFAFAGRYEGLTDPGLYTKMPTDPEFQPKFRIHARAVVRYHPWP